MHRKRVDPVAEDAKSAQFLAKGRGRQLTKAAKSHKQQSKVKFHQFEYIHTSRDLAGKRKAAEEDLRTWLRDKAASDPGVWAETLKTVVECEQRTEQEARSLTYQVAGARDLVQSLSHLVGAGKRPRSSDIAAHLTEVKEFIAEGYSDLGEQQAALEDALRSVDIAEMEQAEDQYSFTLPDTQVPG